MINKCYFLSLIVSMSLLNFACKTNNNNQDFIFVKGNITGLPSKKVYLAEAHEWNKFLDSADIINNKFEFRFKNAQEFVPFMASITYFDSISGKLKTLEFKNHILSPDITKYVINAFYLEKGIIQMNGPLNSVNKFINIRAGQQTASFFQCQMMSFGYVDQDNSFERDKQILKYISLIKKYPSSYYLIAELINNKELYSKDELTKYLDLFMNEVQTSKLGLSLSDYINNKPKFDVELTKLELKTSNGEFIPIFDSTKSLNFLIFWASWCAPCRAEIPELKKMYNYYKDKDVAFSSISIDENQEKWHSALIKENMEWRQFIVDSSDINNIKYKFDFSSIPFLLIISKKGYPVFKSIGFNNNSLFDQRKRLIDSLLAN